MSVDQVIHVVEQLMDTAWSYDCAEEVATDAHTAVACEFLTSTDNQTRMDLENQRLAEGYK